jgi:hypothetical protein
MNLSRPKFNTKSKFKSLKQKAFALKKRQNVKNRRAARSMKDDSRDQSHLIPQEWYHEFDKVDLSDQITFFKAHEEREHQEFMKMYNALEERGMSYWRMYDQYDD